MRHGFLLGKKDSNPKSSCDFVGQNHSKSLLLMEKNPGTVNQLVIYPMTRVAYGLNSAHAHANAASMENPP